MSARLNMNPIRYESWKGKTFNQIVSIVKKNKDDQPIPSNRSFFRSRPLKIQRRELLTANDATHIHNPRASVSIDVIDRPNGTLVTETERCDRGLELVLDMNTTTNTTNNGSCTITATCIAENAKRRVRSSGMNRKTFNPANNAQNYYSDNKQYLISRNKTFQQNQYAFVRQGELSVIDGINKTNIYTPAGLSPCEKAYILEDGNNNFFAYTWLDDTYSIQTGGTTRLPDTEYEVHFSTGYYNIDDFNTRLQKVMEENGHYVIHRNTYAKTFFIKFIYNTTQDKIELQCFPYTSALYPSSTYSIPIVSNAPAWIAPVSSTIPAVRFIDNEISRITGFAEGYYPDISPWLISTAPPYNEFTNFPVKTNEAFGALSNRNHYLFPMYTVITYKPNNNRFDNQGAVSSSTRVLREKYDAITTNGTLFAEPFGKEVANAMAYGVSEYVYTKKDKIGYPLRSTPVVSKYSGEMVAKSCSGRKNMYNG